MDKVALNFGKTHAPKGWVVQASVTLIGPAPESAKLFAGASEGLHPTVNVSVSRLGDSKITAEQLLRMQEKSLAQDLPRFRIVSKKAVQTLKGEIMPTLRYTFETGGTSMRQVQALRVVADKVYYLTATAPDASFEAHWGQFKGILASYEPGYPV